MDDEHHQLFTRRAMILGGAQGVLLLTLVGRMYSLQILAKNHYQTLSDKNRIHTFLVTPDRGTIFDDAGHIIAGNKNTYYGEFDRDIVSDVDDLISKLKTILNLTDDELKDIQKQIKTKRRVESIIIRDNISWNDVARMEVNLHDLPGVRVEKVRSRHYPTPESFSHAIGFVGMVNDKDREHKKTPLMMAPGFRLGKTGLEKQYEDRLQGHAGSRQVEVNAVRKIVRTLSTTPANPGESLNLHIHGELQTRVYEILRPILSGACIVMDIQTGGVKSFVSFPGFDSNIFTNRITHAQWGDLSHNIYKPLVNKCTSGLYAPGSTFKMITALAALEAGVTTPEKRFYCPGHFDVNGLKFHCWSWRYGGHGHMNLQNALSRSCDVYFYNLAMRLKPGQIADMAKKFGLGTITGIDIPGEKSGLIPTPSWKRTIRGQRWNLGETVNMSIGQGALLTTPLQLAKMSAMLANGGKIIRPHFVKTDSIDDLGNIDINPDHLKAIHKGLTDAVNGPGGTGRRAKLSLKDTILSGKTGSTQVSRITLKQRRDGTLNDRPWHLKEHALFTGYTDKYAIVVLVEHGGGGGRVAAPIAKKVMEAVREVGL